MNAEAAAVAVRDQVPAVAADPKVRSTWTARR